MANVGAVGTSRIALRGIACLCIVTMASVIVAPVGVAQDHQPQFEASVDVTTVECRLSIVMGRWLQI
jgi:hypothetical protein